MLSSVSGASKQILLLTWRSIELKLQKEYLTKKFRSVFFCKIKKGNALPLRDTAIYSERHNYFVRVSLESYAWSPSRR